MLQINHCGNHDPSAWWQGLFIALGHPFSCRIQLMIWWGFMIAPILLYLLWGVRKSRCVSLPNKTTRQFPATIRISFGKIILPSCHRWILEGRHRSLVTISLAKENNTSIHGFWRLLEVWVDTFAECSYLFVDCWSIHLCIWGLWSSRLVKKASSCQAQAASNEPTDERTDERADAGADERAHERADEHADECAGGTFRVWGVQQQIWAQVTKMEVSNG